MGVELRVELLEGGLADPAFGSLEQGGEAALGQLHLVPPVVADLAEGHVDIGELGEGFVMAAEDRHREGEQALLPVSEDMGLQPAEAGEGSLPVGESRIGQVGGEGLIVDFLDLRSHPGAGLADLRAEGGKATVPVEGVVVGAVLGNTEARILGQTLRGAVERLFKFQHRGKIGGTAAERSLERNDAFVAGGEIRELGFPGGVVREDRSQIPGIPGGNLRASLEPGSGAIPRDVGDQHWQGRMQMQEAGPHGSYFCAFP